MTQTAAGTFEVTMEPLPADQPELGRFRIAKTFAGELTGTGRAEMLSVGTGTEGSAGYVAIDRIDATLHGRRGSFVVLHCEVMERGHAGSPRLVVVPDSGTGELTGLRGEFGIEIVDGQHRYSFAYTVEPA